MTKPLIGVACDVLPVRHRRKYTFYQTYVAALRSAGAFVLGVPPDAPERAAAVLDRVDGLVLPGGDDLHPRHWGEEEVHPAVTLSAEERSLFELSLVQGAVERDVPILGICLGFQTLNVALGGGILQHLDPGLGHGTGEGTPAETNEHPILVEPGSLLRRLVERDRVEVNSGHHQGLAEIAPDLRVCARAPDGVVEALEHPDRTFCLGVQWHPEERPEDRVSRALFRGLVAAADEGPS